MNAKRIARECGILRDADIDGETAYMSVIEGPEFGKMHEEGRHEDFEQNIRVVARCSPDNMLLYVQSLKKFVHRDVRVAMTADSSNDAPAL